MMNGETTAAKLADEDKNPEDKTSTVDFRFGKDSDIKPDLSGVAMDTEVTITLKGVITSFSHDKDSKWNNDSRITVKMSSCEMEKNTEPEETSLDDALNNANESRRKV
jgi:hypothetical protein